MWLCLNVAISYSKHELPLASGSQSSIKLTATKQKLPKVPEPASSPDKDIADPIHKNRVDPIYEYVETSVQQPTDVTANDVEMEDNPAYGTSVL